MCCTCTLWRGISGPLQFLGRGGVAVRASNSCAEGLRFEPNSRPSLNARSLFNLAANGYLVATLRR